MESVTLELAWKAQQLGACSVPRPGVLLSELSFSQLLWAHDRRLVSSKIPLWALATNGCGNGDGNGYGNGYGYGYGYGNGYGDGYGYGDGNGDGDGYGNGYGYGYGYGNGYGYGLDLIS